MPQSEAAPRPLWASREGLVIPTGPDNSASVTRKEVRLTAILQTLYRCGLALDESNAAALTDCLTSDVVLRATVAGEISFPVHNGPADVIIWFRELSLSTGACQQRLMITNAILTDLAGSLEPVSFVLMVSRTRHGVVEMLATGTARRSTDRARRLADQQPRHRPGFTCGGIARATKSHQLRALILD